MKQTLTKLSDAVANAVKQAAAEQVGSAPDKLEIIKAEKRTWPNPCLGLPQPGEFCNLAKVEGWRVEVANPENGETWVYRTSLEAGDIRLEKEHIYSGNLPAETLDAVLQDAAQRSRLPMSDHWIVNAEQRTWPNSCLDLPQPHEGCVAMLVEGWRVEVANDRFMFIYRTTFEGGEIRLEDTYPTQDRLNPDVANLIKEKAAGESGLSVTQLQIVEAEAQTWRNSCLGLPEPGEFCAQQLVEGWRVVVGNDCQTWVYRSDRDGSSIRLETPHHTSLGNLPGSVTNAVFQDIAQKSGVSVLALRIVDVEAETWPDRCLGLSKPDESADEEAIDGWRVAIAHGDRTWIYRSDLDGSHIRLERQDRSNDR